MVRWKGKFLRRPQVLKSETCSLKCDCCSTFNPNSCYTRSRGNCKQPTEAAALTWGPCVIYCDLKRRGCLLSHIPKSHWVLMCFLASFKTQSSLFSFIYDIWLYTKIQVLMFDQILQSLGHWYLFPSTL